MFTVKHTSPEYIDTLYTAQDVQYTPQSVNSAGETVWVAGPLLPTRAITSGVVYVMNDAGATVAKYDLDASRRGPDPVG